MFLKRQHTVIYICTHCTQYSLSEGLVTLLAAPDIEPLRRLHLLPPLQQFILLLLLLFGLQPWWICLLHLRILKMQSKKIFQKINGFKPFYFNFQNLKNTQNTHFLFYISCVYCLRRLAISLAGFIINHQLVKNY